MKIIYKASIADQIVEANAEALLAGKEIKEVHLTLSEGRKLGEELGELIYQMRPLDLKVGWVGLLDGVRVKVVE